jgi:hypothetical protein
MDFDKYQFNKDIKMNGMLEQAGLSANMFQKLTPVMMRVPVSVAIENLAKVRGNTPLGNQIFEII